jgi:hypothetical protein
MRAMVDRSVTSRALIRDMRGWKSCHLMFLLLLSLAVSQSLDAGDITSELAVAFAVPAVVTPSESGACRLTPSFERLEATPSVLHSLFSDSTAREAEVITIASSSDERMVRGVSIASEAFWQVATGPASCLSQCIRLPLGATLTELTLTYSNGRVPCLVKPIDGRVTPTLIGIVCQDSAWPEVLVQPGSPTLVCATATNFSGLRRPTLHRLLLKYRHAVQGQ